MAFVRKTEFFEPLPNDQTLTSRMRGIGMSFVSESEPSTNPNVEMTLVHASIAGLDERDYRVLRSLCSWIEVHSTRINVDRLFQTLKHCESELVICFWSAISARLLKADPRFKRIRKLYDGPALSILGESTKFQVSRHGYDERFDETILEVPANLVPSRPGDVFTPTWMMKHNRTYFWRTLIGSTWRRCLGVS